MTTGVVTGGVRFARGDSGVPAGWFELATGTAAGQVDQIYFTPLNIAAGVTLQIDLKGGGGELDLSNRPLALAHLKWLYLEITTPASGVRYDLGPQGVTNAFQGWWPGVTSSDKTGVRSQFEMLDQNDGWAVGSTTKILAVKNPGGATVAGFLIAAGTTV